MDPRRVATHVEVSPSPIAEDTNLIKPEYGGPIPVNKAPPLDAVTTVESLPAPVMSSVKTEVKISESPAMSKVDQPKIEDNRLHVPEEPVDTAEVCDSQDQNISPLPTVDEDSVALESSDVDATCDADPSSLLETNQQLPTTSTASASEEIGQDLPPLPSYVELTEEQQKRVRKLAVEHVIESYKHINGADRSQMGMGLLARLIAQVRILKLVVSV